MVNECEQTVRGGNLSVLDAVYRPLPLARAHEAYACHSETSLDWQHAFPSLDEAIENGCNFSVNTVMLRGAKRHRILERLPQNRVLTESDGQVVLTRGRAVSTG